ncbi:hypothetical protein J6590_083895 [Homalodisca vitripennis]|nr:hypothetical protein J6590_083895 [Homalodisca vitripennis]
MNLAAGSGGRLTVGVHNALDAPETSNTAPLFLRSHCLQQAAELLLIYDISRMIFTHNILTDFIETLRHSADCDRPGLLYSVKMHTIKWKPAHCNWAGRSWRRP